MLFCRCETSSMLLFKRNNGAEAIHQNTTSYAGVWLQSLGSIYWDVLSVGFMWMREKLPSGKKSPQQDRQSPSSLHMLSPDTMDSYFRALCMTFVLASFTRRSGASGPVIRCEPCDDGARLLCKPLHKDCAEKVREPGCGCCMTCALSFGQPCGVYTGRCGSGLTCQHQPGETKPLQALLEGRGICVNVTNRRPTVRPTPPVNELPGKSVHLESVSCSVRWSMSSSLMGFIGFIRIRSRIFDVSSWKCYTELLLTMTVMKSKAFNKDDISNILINVVFLNAFDPHSNTLLTKIWKNSDVFSVFLNFSWECWDSRWGEEFNRLRSSALIQHPQTRWAG